MCVSLVLVFVYGVRSCCAEWLSLDGGLQMIKLSVQQTCTPTCDRAANGELYTLQTAVGHVEAASDRVK